MDTRFAPPFLIDDAAGSGTPLERLPLDSPPFTEAELQEVLRRHPELLAIRQIDPLFADPICIGREVQMAGLPLDNLYISPQGGITIVETKLWKNPEARRHVVAQIIEYSKELAKRSYADLEAIAAGYIARYEAGGGACSLFRYVCDRSGDEPPEEQEFAESVARNLRSGRFLLLIVGEGIRDSAQDLVEHLSRSPALSFNLRLVELGCYRLPPPDGRLLMVPRVLARTVEIERAIVTIRMPDGAPPQLRVDVATPRSSEKPDQGGGERRVDPSRLQFSELLTKAVGPELAQQTFDFVDRLGGLGVNGTDKRSMSGLSLRYQPRFDDDAEMLSLFLISDKGVLRNGGWVKDQLAKNGLSDNLRTRFWARLEEIQPGLGFLKSGTDSGFSESVPLATVAPKFAQLEAAVADFIREVEAAGTAKQLGPA